MEKEYYILWVKLFDVDQYMIWATDDIDFIVTDDQKKLVIFETIQDAKSFANSNNIVITDEEPILHNLDIAYLFLDSKTDELDCDELLTTWNLFTDISFSTEKKYIGDQKNELRDNIYDKLFFGNNLPSINQGREDYIPEWSMEEIDEIKNILSDGFCMLKEYYEKINCTQHKL